MFYCHNCGTGGNAVTLYSSFNPNGVTLKNYESYKALLNEPSVRRYDVSVISPKAERPIRDINERSEIYSELLRLLRLNPAIYKSFEQRA